MKSIFWYGLYALGAVVVSVYLLFPGRQVAASLSARLTRSLDGTTISIADARLMPPLALGLEKIVLGGAFMAAPLSPPLHLDRVVIKPIFSTLLGHDRAFQVDAQLHGGTVRATLTAPFSPARDLADTFMTSDLGAQFERVAIQQFRYAHARADVTLSCQAAGRVDLSHRPGKGMSGNGTLHLSACAVDIDNEILAALGVPGITFTAVEVVWHLAGDRLEIRQCKAIGPEMRVDLTGTISLAMPVSASRLALTGHLVPDTAYMAGFSDRSPLFLLFKQARGQGLSFKVTGTLDRPGISL